MEKNDRTNWERDFSEFLAAEPARVPSELSQSVVDRISSALRPSALRVFGKMSAIHLLTGLATLAYCPQFGISFFSSMGLMAYLMRFGNTVCMLACGALFTSLSLFLASLLLRPEEVRILKQNEFVQLGFLSTLSLGAFIIAGADVGVAFAAPWLLGAFLGGLLLLEVGWNLRRRIAQKGAL